jgi:hypothetical protein
MDAVSQKSSRQIIIILLVLTLMELIGSVNGIINHYYYNYNTQSFTGIFKSTLVRFAIRESLIYITAIIGFYSLSRLLYKCTEAKIFLLTTITLDIFFISSGILRQLGFDNLAMGTAYANIFNIIGTGMLFLFFSTIPTQIKSK